MTTTDAKRRPAGRNQSTPQKILSAGLATATCVGIVGILGARAIEANAAASDTVDLQVDTQPIAAEATTSAGLTQADLDAYAQQLETERAQLDAYRAKLVRTAAKLRKVAATQATAPAQTSTARTQQVSVPATSSKPKVKAVPKAAKPPKAAAAPKAAPAPKAASKPAPRPQSNTKGS